MLRLGPHHKFTGSDEDGGALPIQESIVTKKSHGSFVILAALVILFGTHKKSIFWRSLTIAVISTGAGAVVDSVWEQEKLEARKCW